MKTPLIALLTAFALLAAGLAAPALAGNHESEGRERGRDASETRGAQAQREHHEGRGAAREERHEAMREARENFTDQMRRTGQAHRECAQAERGDNNTSSNATDEAIRACHHQVRDDLHQSRLEARTHFQEAKRLAQEKYRDALAHGRAAYLQERGDAHGDDAGCKQNESCISAHLERLEAQKARAEKVSVSLAAQAADLQAQIANATGNDTDAAYHAQDALYGVEIRMLKIERLIFRIDARIAEWESAFVALGTSSDGTADSGAGNTTANETAS